MVFTLNLPEKLERQLKELSNQKSESLESIILNAISYYVLVYKNIIEDLSQRNFIAEQKKIQSLRGRFKGCLSTSQEFATQKRLEKKLEL